MTEISHEALAKEIAIRIKVCRIDEDVLARARRLRGVVNKHIRRQTEEYCANIQRRFPDQAERIGEHKAALVESEAELFDLLFAGDFGPDYVRAVVESVLQEAASGLGARVRSSVGLRLCEVLFKESLRFHPISAKAAVQSCHAVMRLLFMDLFTAISLDQQMTRKALGERQRSIEQSTSEFLQSMASARSTMEEASRTMTEAVKTTQNLTENARHETTRTESTWSAGTERIRAMAEGARGMSASMAVISDQSDQSRTLLQGASEHARTTEQSMHELATAAQKIGSITGLISKIASQTNLLALNATIEATQAGEAGRGFAVVASEVKTLSAQTSGAANEIEQQIAQIQAATQDCVDKIGAIARTMVEITDLAGAMVEAVSEQSRVTNNIAAQADEFASRSDEVMIGARNVATVLDDTQTAASSLDSAAELLAELSVGIDKDVHVLMERMRAA